MQALSQRESLLCDQPVALEAKGDALRVRLEALPTDTPDVHPNIADTYRRKVERLAESLDHAEERNEAADALRGLIARVTLLPGKRRGAMNATLHGKFGAILAWVEARQQAETTKRPERSSRAFRGEILIEADIRPCLDCR